MDLANMKAKNVGVFTDKNVAQLPSVQVALDSLTKAGVNFKVYDDVRVEPTDISFGKAIDYAKQHNFDAYLAIGGGSVMDTCKAANLFACNPEAELLDYVAPPTGKGKPITDPLKPLIAVPTTISTSPALRAPSRTGTRCASPFSSSTNALRPPPLSAKAPRCSFSSTPGASRCIR